MLRFRGTVAYKDGREVTFETGTAGLRKYEQYAARHGLPMGDGVAGYTLSMIVAHYALDIKEGFDVWADTVDGIELEEVEPLPPTLAEVSEG